MSRDRTGLKPLKPNRKLPVQFALATAWLVFTLALASWWLMFGLSQLDEIESILRSPPSQHLTGAENFRRRHNMLLSEGIVLFVLLLGGGVAILYSLSRESRRARRVEEFFAIFSHDLKTSLASLRLQSETLVEGLTSSAHSNEKLSGDAKEVTREQKIMNRILGDVARLETQLENALYVAESDRLGHRKSLLLEPISWNEVVQNVAPLWPKLQFEMSGDVNPPALAMADRRSLETILRNLAQNAIRHGGATAMKIRIEKRDDVVIARFSDNGRGFTGDREKLGEIFSRHTGTSGSGLGLFLTAELARAQGGVVHVLNREVPNGFGLEIILPSGSAT